MPIDRTYQRTRNRQFARTFSVELYIVRVVVAAFRSTRSQISCGQLTGDESERSSLIISRNARGGEIVSRYRITGNRGRRIRSHLAPRREMLDAGPVVGLGTGNARNRTRRVTFAHLYLVQRRKRRGVRLSPLSTVR